MLKVGFIGFGRIGRLHFKHLFERAIVDKNIEISKICCTTQQKKDFVQNLYGYPDTMFVNNYKDLINSDVNVVINSSATNFHYEINKECILRGKHLFTEKPCATEVSQLDELIDLNSKQNVKVGVNYNRRFSKNFMKMKQAIQNGDIGNVECLRVSSRDPKPSEKEFMLSCGGLFKDFTVHDFDTTHFLMGEKPVKIFAQGSAIFLDYLKEVNDYDTAVIVLSYKNGQINIIENSRRSGFNYDQRVEVFGSKGALVNSNRCENEVEKWSQQGRVRDLGYESFLEYYSDAIGDSLNAYFDYVQGKRDGHVSLEDARYALKMAIAAQESAKSGKQVEIE